MIRNLSRAILSFCLVMFLAFPAVCLTLSEIRTAVRLYISDNDSSNQRWSDSQLNILVNQGQRDAALKTLLLENTTSFLTVSGRACHTLPTDVMQIRRVTHKDKVLDQKSIAGLDGLTVKWETVTGDPQFYYILRSTQVCFYPIPVTASTGTVKIFYTYSPSSLSSDTDEPFGGLDSTVAFHDLITYWTVFQCLTVERRLTEASVFWNMYLVSVQQARDSFFLNPNWSPNFSGRPRP